MRHTLFLFGFILLIASACTSERTPAGDAGTVADTGTGTVDSGGVDAGPPTHCGNGLRDGDETHLDCGGSCDPCGDGEGCARPTDCTSGVCVGGFCLMASCMDGILNQDETDVDCGGAVCGGCAAGGLCALDTDCASGLCDTTAGTCSSTSCTDGVQNSDETDVDCGGSCPGCPGDGVCNVDEDCASLICLDRRCTTASCDDRVHNGDETDEDCGGSCPGCRDASMCLVNEDCESMQCQANSCISCLDGRQNGDETDIDCGGPLCGGCADTLMCVLDTDCTGMRCVAGECTSCMDSAMNGDETDVDCGGTICSGCADGLMCTLLTDCASGVCEAGACVSCMDGTRNQDETDVDCGGAACPGCAAGLMCTMASDCASSICDGPTMLCNAAGCGDGVLNGMETDLDCGGGVCLGCATGGTCVIGRDCLSGVCTGGICAAPTCSDSVANGDETDVDCGGPTCTARCADFRRCAVPGDCVTAACTMGFCGTTGCVPFPGTSTDAFGYFACSLPLTPTTLPCANIASTGTALNPTDDDHDVVPMGFSFDFYGTAYTSATVQSNGTITFHGAYFSYGNICFPRTTGTPDRFIAPLWDDLDPGNAGSQVWHQTMGTAPNRTFVVQWDTERFSSTPNRAVFQVVLHETTNDIEICYEDAQFGSAAYDLGASATTGIDGPGAGDGLQYSCNTASLADGLYLQYFHP